MKDRPRQSFWQTLFRRGSAEERSQAGETSRPSPLPGQPPGRVISPVPHQLETEEIFRRRLSRTVAQQDGDPPIEIDPRAITFGFGVIGNQHGLELAKMDAMEVLQLNRNCQPKIFTADSGVRLDVAWFSANTMNNAYPDVVAIPGLLEVAGRQGLGGGLQYSYSLVINMVGISPDQGKSEMKALIGFAFRDEDRRDILARIGGCVPTTVPRRTH